MGTPSMETWFVEGNVNLFASLTRRSRCAAIYTTNNLLLELVKLILCWGDFAL